MFFVIPLTFFTAKLKTPDAGESLDCRVLQGNDAPVSARFSVTPLGQLT
jgi:hypothetical protein